MEPRISVITLSVADVARARAFYIDGLGWPVHFEAPSIVMIRVGEHLLLSLWDRAGFMEEVGAEGATESAAPITLAHNVRAETDVDEVLAEARAAGAEVSPATRREWGGYSGYFADPDGYRWEVASVGGDEALGFLVP